MFNNTMDHLFAIGVWWSMRKQFVKVKFTIKRAANLIVGTAFCCLLNAFQRALALPFHLNWQHSSLSFFLCVCVLRTPITVYSCQILICWDFFFSFFKNAWTGLMRKPFNEFFMPIWIPVVSVTENVLRLFVRGNEESLLQTESPKLISDTVFFQTEAAQ